MKRVKREVKTIRGVLQGNANGYAFLLNDDGDYFIAAPALHGAMNGDEVVCREVRLNGHRKEAEVIKILSRGLSYCVGTFVVRKNGGFVVPDDRRVNAEIFVPPNNFNGAETGDKVNVKITGFYKHAVHGKVIEVLGRQFDFGAEIKSIERTYNLAGAFGRNVIKEAELAAERKTDESCRTDFTGELIVTIDGEDAKDFDDAVTVKKQGEFYRLGVHIADVAHYVAAGGALDKEAFSRGTSVYFPMKVIPMLPERLCNDVCSLRPGERRYTLSLVMKVDKNGSVISSNITEGVIKSAARLTYNEVNDLYKGSPRKDYGKIGDMLFVMKELAEILIEKRKRRGGVDLSVREAEIRYVDGEIQIGEHERGTANRVIEEFMILANETVAETMFKNKYPCVYRVHENPSEEKLNAFYEFLKGIGIAPPKSADFAELLKRTEEEPTFQLVNRVMLRSMQKAKYSPKDIGHFGLASEHYCHFTSPIRRYPDLAVHRIIKEKLARGEKHLHDKFDEFVSSASAQSSETERNAELAERAVDDYCKTLYMSGKVGEEYDGIISGVTNFGLFVELENTVEGLVRIETLKGGWYDFDEKHFVLKNKKNEYRLGQTVRIKVAGVNLALRRTEFMLV